MNKTKHFVDCMASLLADWTASDRANERVDHSHSSKNSFKKKHQIMFMQNLKRTVAIASLLLASSGSLYAQFGGVQVSVGGYGNRGYGQYGYGNNIGFNSPYSNFNNSYNGYYSPYRSYGYNNTSLYGGYYNNSSYYPVRSYNTVGNGWSSYPYVNRGVQTRTYISAPRLYYSGRRFR